MPKIFLNYDQQIEKLMKEKNLRIDEFITILQKRMEKIPIEIQSYNDSAIPMWAA